jgi:Ca2+-binding EF-hand superfamily protein
MVQSDIDMDQMPETPDQLVDEIMELMDSDNDNKLSRVEFMDGCQKNPHLLKVIKPL